MKTSIERSSRGWIGCALLLALCLLPQPGLAKLNAAPGDDGAPPDPNDEAAVDALNDALDGPDEGQSTAEWEAEFQAAHDALYGSTTSTTSTNSGVGGGAVSVTETDLCQSPLDAWLSSGTNELVVDALSDTKARADLTTELENLILHKLRIETAGSVAAVGRPTLTGLSCDQCEMSYVECLTAGFTWQFCKMHYLNCPSVAQSEFSVSVPVTLVEFGLSLKRGTVTAQASASQRSDADSADWCVDIESYAISGFDAATLALIRPRITAAFATSPFCLPAFGAAYVVH